ncbi:phosphohydrolase [uncultured Desulfosarcina sp.]|uniref:phosphohydrolase n=1 Tax=uncultured Desulfosarcina sp. TaxID=218289 RepID=UPI0037499D76
MEPLNTCIDPKAIITAFYPAGSRTRNLLLRHGELVGRKAIEILDRSPWIDADREFVVQAAMLHDIGVGRTRCPELGCTGTLPYVCHGVEGRAILDKLGLGRHGLVCERHVGVGISADQAMRRKLPLPARDMIPLSVEERLICYADKFFSKTDDGRHEKTIDEIIAGLTRYEAEYADRFLTLHRLFNRNPVNTAGFAATISIHGKTQS